MKSLKNILASAAIAAASILPMQSKAADIPKPFVQTTFASDYVAPSGIVTPGKVAQTWTSINPIESLSLGIAQNYSFKKDAINERDYVVSYNKKLTDKLSLGLSASYWHYPTGEFGQFDSVEGATLNYSGKVNFGLDYCHLNRNSDHGSGDRINPSVSKAVSLVDGKTKLSLTPSFSGCLANDFYGLNGLTQVRGGLSLGVSRGNFSASASLTKQIAIDKNLPDTPFYFFSASYQF